MAPWRNFAPEYEDIATRCSVNPFTEEPFTPDGAVPIGGGGTTAQRVTMNESGHKAWVKPARNNPGDVHCAAHEKIAADLAYQLGLPVPPVALTRHTAPAGGAPIAALSYEVLPQGRPWQQAEGLLTPEIKATIKSVMSAMWAFHAWINDTDHNWNGGNIIVELHATEPVRLAFIDYSFSLSKYWNPPAAPNPQDWRARPGNYTPCDEGAIDELIEKIEKLSLTDFDRVIRRIPEDCLAIDLVDRLIAGLDARRAHLRGLLRT